MNTLPEIVDELTDGEAHALLAWLARNRPSQLRDALRHGPDRAKYLYEIAGKPHA